MKQIIGLILFLFLINSLLYPNIVGAHENLKIAIEAANLVEPVVAKPDMRVYKLEKYLKSKNSPMAESAEIFISEADRLELDWRLVASISGNESYFGQMIPFSSYNAWGWGVWTGRSFGLTFDSWEHGIQIVSEGLKENYIDHGLTNVDAIGRKYAADRNWSWKVQHFMDEIESYDPYNTDERLLALSL